jgi:histidinol phosphatase-like enzyme
MKSLRVNVVLAAALLAILGAVLHPLSVLLGLAPFDTRPILAVLADIRTVIGNLLGWGLFSLVAIMLVYVIRGRVLRPTRDSAMEKWFRDVGSPADGTKHGDRVVVAITAFNDAAATAQAVRDFKRQPSVIQVLVIDNNSTDQTATMAAEAGAKVIREAWQGYGYACIRGLSEASKIAGADVVVLVEGDGTFVAEDLSKFLAYTSHADLVLGNRVVRGLVDGDSQMDYFFTWGNMAVAMLVRIRFWDARFLGPGGLSDVGCTYRAIRREALERILPDLVVGGSHFSPHMILVALASGLSVVEIPVRFRRRVGKSKGASQSFLHGLKVGAAMIWHVMTFAPASAAHKRGVIVERDGVLIRHPHQGDQLHQDVEFVPGAVEGLANLSRHGHKIAIVGDELTSAQTGNSQDSARGVDALIAAEVARMGGQVDAFVLCDHGANDGCSCRFPTPRLVIKAAQRLQLDPTRAITVSNRRLFLDAASELGCSTILISDDTQESRADDRQADASDLAAAVRLVLAGDSEAANGRPPTSAEVRPETPRSVS